MSVLRSLVTIFFFNDTATTEIYTLSLHDALPIWDPRPRSTGSTVSRRDFGRSRRRTAPAWRRSRDTLIERAGSVSSGDRKSTRLNSSHANISYAVFCLKKKKNIKEISPDQSIYMI